uniref:undecaprenyl-diphosphate phosphatase n=1 Tax=Actinoplanes sp. RD1 TaxID=3064538 RepID=UPI0027427480
PISTGQPATITSTIVSFVVGWLAVSWLLKFIAKHSYSIFIGYRLVLGSLLMVLLATGAIEPK